MPVRVINMQYKSSCVWSFQIRLNLFMGPKGTKGTQENCVCLCAQQWISWKISLRINTKLDARSGGFVLMGLSCYRRRGFLFCELLKGFKTFVILLLISVWQWHVWSQPRSSKKNRTQSFPCLGPYSCSVGEKNKPIPLLGNLPSLIFFNPKQ